MCIIEMRQNRGNGGIALAIAWIGKGHFPIIRCCFVSLGLAYTHRAFQQPLTREHMRRVQLKFEQSDNVRGKVSQSLVVTVLPCLQCGDFKIGRWYMLMMIAHFGSPSPISMQAI